MPVDYEALAKKYGGQIVDDEEPAQQIDYEALAAKHGGQVVDATGTPEPDKPGFFASAADLVTGNLRTTPEIEALPEWTDMPELNQMSMASFKTALGTMLTNPAETTKILQANFPGSQVRQDAKGNYILKSSVDGKEYAIPPGLSVGDIPRVLGGLLAFTPAGRATTIPGAAAAGAGTQAVIEATQAGTGGRFDTGEVITAGVTGAGGQAVAQALPKVVQGVKQVTGKAPKPAQVADVAPEIPVQKAPETYKVYRGISPTGPNDFGVAGKGEYTSGRRQVAEAYAGGTGKIEEKVIELNNPLKSTYVELNDLQKTLYGKPLTGFEEDLSARFDQYLRKQGYDGVVLFDPEISTTVPEEVIKLAPTLQATKAGSAAQTVEAAPTAAAAQAVPGQPVAQTTTEAFEEVGDLVRKASGSGLGSKAARDRLAELAAVNPEAKAAADRLGLELPFDVFSDNPQIRAAVGLTRSVAGGEAEAAWVNTVRNAITKADDVVQQFDAAFIEGRPAPGATSQRILDSLNGTQAQLAKDASAIYQRVDETIPKTSNVQFPRLTQTLDEVLAEVGEKGLTAQEKKLYELAIDPKATYGRLLREKNLIGQAVAGKESPYGNMDAASLKRLYAALAEDQLANVGTIGGDALRQELRAANLLTAKKKALENRIVGAFGKEIDGSVATLMQSAIKSAAKGDAAQFNKLMKVVPPELRKETIATALASVSSSARAGQEGAFGFAEFAKTYRGLRANPPVYKQAIEILGKDADPVLRDLFEISRRITDARAQVLTTGKANQALVEALKAEGLVGKVMQSTMAQRAVTGAASVIPGGGFMAPDIIKFMTHGDKDAVRAAGKLFASDEFQKLAIEAATRQAPSASTISNAAKSKAFTDFAKAARLPQSLDARMQWLNSAVQTAHQFKEE